MSLFSFSFHFFKLFSEFLGENTKTGKCRLLPPPKAIVCSADNKTIFVVNILPADFLLKQTSSGHLRLDGATVWTRVATYSHKQRPGVSSLHDFIQKEAPKQ